MPHTHGGSLRLPSTGSAVTTNPLTASINLPAGTTVLVVGIGAVATTARTGGNPTFNGVALQSAGSKRDAGGTPEEHVESIYYMLNPPTGSALTLSIPNSNGIAIGAYIAWASSSTGVSALDTNSGAAGSSTNPAASVNSSQIGNYVFAICGNGANTFAPSGQSGTALNPTGDNDFGNWGIAAQYVIPGASGSQATNWTFGTSEDWTINNISFVEVAVLSGVQGTGQTGSAAPLVSKTATGVQATGQAGSVRTFADVRQAIIDGITAASSPTNGWNNTVKPAIPVANVVRNSDTQITITLPAVAGYDISVDEILTAILPASALVSGIDLTASPTIEVDAINEVTVNLTGVAGTSAIGSVGKTPTIGVSGISGAIAAGLLASITSLGVTGAQASTQIGTHAVASAKAITGLASTSAQGTIDPHSDYTIALTGQGAVTAIGSLTQQLDRTLSGIGLSSNIGNTVTTPTILAIGVEAASAQGSQNSTSSQITPTGQSAAGAVGNVAHAGGQPLTGVSTATAVASLIAANVMPASGLASTGVVNSLPISQTCALTGVSASGVAGDINKERTFEDVRQAIIDGITAATSPSTGWNNIVKPAIPVANVVRNSETQVTITLPAVPGYDISADELLTVIVPAIALESNQALNASPTIPVDEDPSVTVSLTGVNAATAINAVTFSHAHVVTGAQANTAVTTVGASKTIALSGVAGTSATGTSTVSVAKGITGQSNTSAIGTALSALSVSTIGAQATGQPGNAVAQTQLAPTGVTSTTVVGNPAASSSSIVTVVGVSANAAIGAVSTASDGVVGLSGIAASSQSGTVGVSRALALVGTPATGSVGQSQPDIAMGLAGSGAAGAVDTLQTSRGLALSGLQAASLQNSVGSEGHTQDELTGVSGQGATGSVVTSRSAAVLGATAASAAGNTSSAILTDVSTVAALSQIGTVTPSSNSVVAITGVAANGSNNAAGVDSTRTLTGTEAQSAIGVPRALGSQLSGTESNGQTGTVGISVTRALSGVSGTSGVGAVSPKQVPDLVTATFQVKTTQAAILKIKSVVIMTGEM